MCGCSSRRPGGPGGRGPAGHADKIGQIKPGGQNQPARLPGQSIRTKNSRSGPAPAPRMDNRVQPPVRPVTRPDLRPHGLWSYCFAASLAGAAVPAAAGAAIAVPAAAGAAASVGAAAGAVASAGAAAGAAAAVDAAAGAGASAGAEPLSQAASERARAAGIRIRASLDILMLSIKCMSKKPSRGRIWRTGTPALHSTAEAAQGCIR
jgi:hypothetical protein